MLNFLETFRLFIFFCWLLLSCSGQQAVALGIRFFFSECNSCMFVCFLTRATCKKV